jgi:hypothetical protein
MPIPVRARAQPPASIPGPDLFAPPPPRHHHQDARKYLGQPQIVLTPEPVATAMLVRRVAATQLPKKLQRSEGSSPLLRQQPLLVDANSREYVCLEQPFSVAVSHYWSGPLVAAIAAVTVLLHAACSAETERNRSRRRQQVVRWHPMRQPSSACPTQSDHAHMYISHLQLRDER